MCVYWPIGMKLSFEAKDFGFGGTIFKFMSLKLQKIIQYTSHNSWRGSWVNEPYFKGSEF